MCPSFASDSGGQWRFRLFGIPVQVQLWFWISVFILGRSSDTGSLLIWGAVCFVSILAHELGHVYAFRMFGVDAEVVLQSFGGLAIPRQEVHGPLARFLVAVAGPAAGFGVLAVTLLTAWFSGASIQLSWHMFIPGLYAYPAVAAEDFVPSYWYVLLNDLLYVNFYWGLVNLLPVHPLDGGHAARAIFEQNDPYLGKRNSLILSAVVACAVALFGVVNKDLYLVLLFGLLAAMSFQAMEAEGRWINP